MPGRRPFDPSIDTEDPENEAESGPHHGPNGSKMAPLSLRSVNEILAMNFDDSDFITKNGYVAKGDPFAICGAEASANRASSFNSLSQSSPGVTFWAGQPMAKGLTGCFSKPKMSVAA